MWKFRKIKGSVLADSYKIGWESAINRLEKLSGQYLHIHKSNQVVTEVYKTHSKPKNSRDGITSVSHDFG